MRNPYPADTIANTPNDSPSPSNPPDLKAIEDYIVSLLRPPKEETPQVSTLPATPNLHSSPPVEEQERKIMDAIEENVGATTEGSAVPNDPESKSVAQAQRWKKKETGNQETLQANQPPVDNTMQIMKLTEDMHKLYLSLKPSEGEGHRRLILLEKLQRIVNNLWPDKSAVLQLFGSSANQFGMKSTDMDISLIIDPTVGNQPLIIKKLGDALKKKRMKGVETRPAARVPIVKFTDPFSNFSCDICINNNLALHNTKLLAEYAKCDPRLREVGLIVKLWAKRRQINDTYQGTLSSYAYILMVINYLQTRRPPVLPVLQQMGDVNQVVDVDGYNCYFYSAETLKDYGKANTETVGELLAGFFKFYAKEFNWAYDVVSVRLGRCITKAEKMWKPSQNHDSRDNYYFAIEDPFETTHNLGKGVDTSSLKVIKYEFRRANNLLSNGESPLSVLVAPYSKD
jgi:DNA polymerase sigma